MMRTLYKKISKKTTLKNFSILSVANLLAQAINLLSSIRLAPLLGPSNYGYFNYILILSTIFSIVSTFGLRIIIIRSIAREPNQTRNYFIRSLLLRAFFLVCSFIILILYINIGQNTINNAWIVVAMMVLIATITLWDTMESISFGNQIMKVSALIDFSFAIVWVIVLYLIPEISFKVNVILITYVAIQILKNIVYLLWLIRSKLLHKTTNSIKPLLSMPDMVKQSSSYFLLAVFTCLQNQIPVLFLENSSGFAQVGIFNLGYRIVSPLQMLINVALAAIFPNLSVLAIKDPSAFFERCKKGVVIIMLTGIVGCFIFTVFSRDVVLLLYKESFEQSARIISIQCWYTAFYGIFSFIGAVWGAVNKQFRLAVFSGISTLIALPILWLGALYGSEGLAFAFIIVSIFNMVYHWYFFASKTFVYKVSAKYSITLWAGFLLYMVIGHFIPQELNLFYKLGIVLCLLAPVFYFFRKYKDLII